MYKELDLYIQKSIANHTSISKKRIEKLNKLIEFINKADKNQVVNLMFICTHNSRRSHLSQIWAQVAAFYYGFNSIKCYSGGTETTALYVSIIKVLKNAGFNIETLFELDNSIYTIKYTDNEPAIVGFSKKYDNNFNPKSNFAAIMTCTHAEVNCPFIPLASTRISLPYNDPKEFDGTEIQEQKYAERSFEIATEMLYVFSKLD